MSLGNAAAKILQRGVEMDNNKRYTEALVCYQEGIQLLVDMLKDEKSDKRKYLRDKIEEYMKRAELIKANIKKLKEEGNYSEQINIENNALNHSYKNVFGRFLDDDVNDIRIEDPYIRSFHQVQNLVRFSELAVERCKNLKSIHLLTTKDNRESESKEQVKWLLMVKESLSRHNVNLTINFSDTLHDRQVIISNGWIIKIGRGLDYFKAPETKFSIGVFNLDYRSCYETIINIFHTNNVKIKE